MGGEGGSRIERVSNIDLKIWSCTGFITVIILGTCALKDPTHMCSASSSASQQPGVQCLPGAWCTFNDNHVIARSGGNIVYAQGDQKDVQIKSCEGSGNGVSRIGAEQVVCCAPKVGAPCCASGAATKYDSSQNGICAEYDPQDLIPKEYW